MKSPAKRDLRSTLLMAVLVTAASLAGCAGSDDTDVDDDMTPQADLVVDRESRYAGEAFTFDAQASEDPNGNITKWIFDFGDGETMEVDNADDARVKHTYTVGGVYNVTLTVMDDGTGQDEPLNATDTKTVVVDERYALGPLLLAAAPTNQSTAARFEQTLDVNETADRFELEISFENRALVAGSRMSVRIIGPDGEAIVDEQVELDPGANETFEVDEDIAAGGSYTLEVVAESGAADGTGELRIFHEA